MDTVERQVVVMDMYILVKVDIQLLAVRSDMIVALDSFVVVVVDRHHNLNNTIV